MKTLLVIFAHPDDESFGPAGATLAKYAAEGVAVHYLCATRGEAGVVDPQQLVGYSSLSELRTAELAKAARALNLTSVTFLDYRDSGMAGSPDNQHPDSLFAAPLDDVAHRVASTIQRLRPDVIVTHDQYGWYGHPDHIKMYEATLRAYEILFGCDWNAPEPAARLNAPRLYVSSFSKWLLKLTARLMPLFGRDPRRHGQNQDVDLVEIASWDVRLTTRVDVSRYLDYRDQAMACHASQCPLTESRNGLFRAVLRRFQSVETFSRVYPVISQHESVETDLFPPEIAYQPLLADALV